MMNTLYSSKLFKGSSRQAQIIAAASDPINSELMTQLADYLDDEYVPLADPTSQPTDTVDDADSEESSKADSAELDEDIDMSDFEVDLGDDFNLDDHRVDYPSTPERGPAEERPSEGGSSEEEPSEEPNKVEEATEIEGNSILGTSGYSQLKEILNEKEATSGVERVHASSEEVWIYYNDSVNLNNKMIDVIEAASECCNSLSFNRLARSENAIVFIK